MVDGNPADSLPGVNPEATANFWTVVTELSPEQIAEAYRQVSIDFKKFGAEGIQQARLVLLRQQLRDKVVRFDDPDGVLTARYPDKDEGEFPLHGRDLHILDPISSAPGMVHFSTALGPPDNPFHKYSFIPPEAFAIYSWQFVETPINADPAAESEQ